MNQPTESYLDRLISGLFEALVNAGKTQDGGTVVVDGSDAVSALISMIAFVMHNSEECSSPMRTRHCCEKLAKRLRIQIAEVQTAVAEGKMPFVQTWPAGPTH